MGLFCSSPLRGLPQLYHRIEQTVNWEVIHHVTGTYAHERTYRCILKTQILAAIF